MNALVLRAAAAALMVLTLGLGWVAADAHEARVRQRSFATPEQAAAALAAAWQNGDKSGLLKMFGPVGMKLVSSGDPVADKRVRAKLAAAYAAGHKIEQQGEHQALLIIGENEFPYPIPLVKEHKGWRFDTEAGEEEILDRRIGRNELNAIEVVRAYVEAQREYAAQDHLNGQAPEYAMKVVSSADKRDGLYWQTAAGEEESPLGPLVAGAAAEGYGSLSADARAPYHGYYFKILTRQGANAPGGAMDYVVDGHMTRGFGLVAYPAKYGDSGVMTFVVNENGIVFEKSLGPDTGQIAQQMTEYNPDRTWQAVAGR